MRVLLVGLSDVLCQAVARRLRASGYDVRVAADVVDADHVVAEAIIADLRRRPLAADHLARWRSGPDAPSLVLAGPGGEHRRGLEAGATDYLLAPFDADAVVDRLEDRLHPSVPVGPELRLRDRTVDLARSVVRGPEDVPLSPMETRLLTYLAERPSRTVPTDTLLEQVWGYRPGVRSRTVVSTVARLRAKIEQDPACPVHLHAAYGIGYRFEPTPRPAPLAEAPTASFLGRESELADLLTRFARGERVVTLLGAAGVGKTRLARRLLADPPCAAAWCDLTEAIDADALRAAAAQALGLQPDVGAGLEATIASRGSLLLVLDNFEQLVEAGAATVAAWIRSAPALRVLVTSRRPLHVEGEHAVPLGPLALPDGDGVAAIEASPAAQLLLARARAANPAFAVPIADHAGHVAAIVRRLDGLPLAIELAAARARVLGAGALSARLERPLEVLRDVHRERVTTLEEAIDASWVLLAPWEQAAFAQCSVFAGGFTLDAAEAVLDLRAWPDAPCAYDVLESLVEQQLLRSDARPDGEPRLHWLVALHAYAGAKLRDPLALVGVTGPAAAVAAEARHAAWFATLGDAESLRAIDGPGGTALLRLLLDDADNLVVAARRAALAGDPNTATAACRAAWRCVHHTGPLSLGLAVLDEVLAVPGQSSAARAELLSSRAQARLTQGRLQEGLADAEQAIVAAGDDPTAAWPAWLAFAGLLRGSGRHDEAEPALDAGMAAARAAGDRSGEARLHHELGNLLVTMERSADARSAFEKAAATFRTLDRPSLALALSSRARLEKQLGRLDLARALYEEALDVVRPLGARWIEAMTLGNLANVHMEQGRLDTAAALYERALALNRAVGAQAHAALALGNLGNLHILCGRYDEALACHRAALEVHEQLGQPGLAANRRGMIADLLARKEPQPVSGPVYRTRMAEFERAATMAADLGRGRTEGITRANQGDFARRSRRYADARRHLGRAVDLALQAEDVRLIGVFTGLLAVLDAEEGHDEEARRRFEDGERHLNQAGADYELAELLVARAGWSMRRGDTEAAHRELKSAEAAVGTVPAGSELERLLHGLRERLG